MKDLIVPKKIIPTTKCVTVHPQLLNYLFNPTLEDRKNYQVQFGPNSKIEMVVTEFSTLQERGLARLPTMAEFKLMLNIWHLAITQNTRFLQFTSSTDVLKQIGYTDCEDNFEMLRRTMDVYWGLSVNFYQYLTRVFRKGKIDKVYLSKQDQTFRILSSKGIIEDKETKELKSVNIEFSLDFWQICHNEEFLRLLDVNKIAKFKSPFALVLYLHLIQWSSRAKPYQKNKLYDFVRFHEELGLLVPEETSKNLSETRFKIQKALNEIKEIDENIKTELDILVFKRQHKIRFLDIKSVTKPPAVPGRKALPNKFYQSQVKKIEEIENKELQKDLYDF
jgi:hypothetical protein